MAKSYQAHQDYIHALSRFGKDLARRSRASCELCAADGVALSVFEVPPSQDPPQFESCFFTCETCREQIETVRKREASHWRCLAAAVWSEVPAVQVMAVLLLRFYRERESWASDLLDDVYLDPEVEEWVNEVRFT